MTDRPMGRVGRMVKVSERAPAFMHAAIELAEHIARLGAARVAELLSVRLVDLQPMLEGRVQPSKTGMRRLRATVQDSER